MRPIDADALLRRVEQWRDRIVDTYGKNDEYANCLVEVVMKIEDAPTIDVPDRKVGKWVWMGDKGDSRWMCSVCKSKENVPTIMGKPIVWGYCPNCGAEMKGGDDDRSMPV